MMKGKFSSWGFEKPVVVANRTRSGRQIRPNRRYQENDWDLGR